MSSRSAQQRRGGTAPNDAAPSVSAVRLRKDARAGAARLHPAAKWLHRMCTSVARRIEAGETQGRALQRFSRRHNGRVVRGGVVLKVSPFTLFRHFKAWRANPSREAFSWQQRGGGSLSRVTPALKEEFLLTCGAPGVFSMAEAYRVMKLKHGARMMATARSFYRILTRAEAAEVRAFHRARFAFKRASLRFANFTREAGR
jgi:hypothetical protein